MPQLGGVDGHEGDGEDESEHKADECLRVDGLDGRDGVLEIAERREDAPEHDGDEEAFKVHLHTAPDDTEDGTQDNEEVRAPDPVDRAGENRVTDMVASGSIAIEDDRGGSDCRSAPPSFGRLRRAHGSMRRR